MSNKIEIKYQQLKGLVNVLERIKKECRLPITKAVHLKRFIRVVETETKLYNDQYGEIIERYAKKDDTGARIIQKGENGDQILLENPLGFTTDLQELFEQSFEVDSVDVDLKLEDLNAMQFTVEELDFLDFLFFENKVIPFPTKGESDASN